VLNTSFISKHLDLSTFIHWITRPSILFFFHTMHFFLPFHQPTRQRSSHSNNDSVHSFMARTFVFLTWGLNWSHSDASINVMLIFVSGTPPAILSGAFKYNDTLRPVKQGLELKLRNSLQPWTEHWPLKLYDTRCV